MSQKVYCIEFGLFPEISILGAYSTTENAQVVVDKIKADYLVEYDAEMSKSELPRIVEMQLDKGVNELSNGLELFEFFYLPDGSWLRCYPVSFSEVYDIKKIGRELETVEGSPYLHGFVFAKDKDSVLQVIKEKMKEAEADKNGKAVLQ